jgi:hypothetical protein
MSVRANRMIEVTRGLFAVMKLPFQKAFSAAEPAKPALATHLDEGGRVPGDLD